jgi:RNA polymerase sigma factor (TIGR02999 family)
LQATARLHEAYIRLTDVPSPQHWSGRRHFFAAAAEAMRRILIERVRQKKRLRHGGTYERVDIDRLDELAPSSTGEILAVHESLGVLEQHNPAAANVVKLRYFGGMTIPEAAEALAISSRQADKLWSYARAWLVTELSPE